MPVYNVGDLSETPSPTRASTALYVKAATRMNEILIKHGIDFVFIGGFALHLLGFERDPGDIDYAINAKVMDAQKKLKDEPE